MGTEGLQPIRALLMPDDISRRKEVAGIVWGMAKAVALIGLGAWMLLELLQGKDPDRDA